MIWLLNTMPIKVNSYGCTDIGLVRLNNEDVWGGIPEHHVYIIADGMGGHKAGEVAASQTVETLTAIIRRELESRKEKKPSDKEMRKILFEAIQEVNDAVHQLGNSSEDLRGMGSTLCCLCFRENDLVYAHVGDSRIYRLRKKKLKLLTKDHSLLREMLDLGQINENQALEFSHRNILTRAVGTEPYVEPTVHVGTIHDGDTYLLCTDGLTDLLTREEIEAILNEASTLEESAMQMISIANARGGHDNTTVVLAQVHKRDETQDLSR